MIDIWCVLDAVNEGKIRHFFAIMDKIEVYTVDPFNIHQCHRYSYASGMTIVNHCGVSIDLLAAQSWIYQ